MAGDRKFRAAKRSDRAVIESLTKIAEGSGLGPAAKLAVRLEGNHQVDCKLSDALANESIRPLLDADGALAQQIVLSGAPGWQVRVVRESHDDEVFVHIADPQHLAFDVAAKALALAEKHLQAYSRSEAIEKVLGTELSEFYRRREQGLLQLEGLAQRLIEETQTYRVELDKKTEERKEHLDDELAKERQKLNDAYAKAVGDLESRETALAEKAKGLEDRDSRHVRRQIRQDLKQALAGRAQTFTLSPTTNQKRKLVHAMFGLLIAATVLSLIYSYSVGLHIDKDTINWPNVIRSVLSGLGFVFSVVFYIRWADQWFRQHADEEFRLKRLELDIDRASWVVEMAMEWKREKEAGVIPREIMEGVTRNLFVDPAASRVSHPTEDLASALLGASAGLALKVPGGAEVKLDRKGIQRFKSAAEDQ